MTSSTQPPVLSEQSQPQQERLFYLEFRLYFLGHVNRSDLQQRFGLKESSASRDIALYKKLAASNLIYDYGLKSYIPRASFKPLFAYTGAQVLSALTHGFGDDYSGPKYPEINSESPSQLPLPIIPTLAALTRAIHKQKALSIHYLSEHSGPSDFEIVPHALIDSGTRWLVRVYDRSSARFRNLIINRITEVKNDAAIPTYDESKEQDAQWNQIENLMLQPHPTIAYPEALKIELGMYPEDKALMMTCRSALKQSLLDHWRVDTGESPSTVKGKYQLWLSPN